MKKIITLISLAILTCYVNGQNNDLLILKNNWKNYLLHQKINKDLEPYFYNLRPDGTWSDLDYNNRQRGNWPLLAHLKRTIEMARAYQQEGSKHYKNKILEGNIQRAYKWWVNTDIINVNWWYPQIGVPQNIGVIMLLMQDEIDPEHYGKGMTIMDRVVFGKQTGQNLVWVSSNIVLRSILKTDTTLITEATRNIRKEMQIAQNKEGLQPDYSFHQHGRQLQFGNYGLHFLEDQVKWMHILKGSAYDYTPEQIDLMRNYFAQGQRWVIWKNVYDINSSGRQLFPDEQLKKYNRVHKAAIEMKDIDPNHADLYKSISEENECIGAKHFPFSELTVKRSKEDFISIRMCSSRIKGSESGNGENLSGYYLADGAMYVMKTGKEYLNIFPYWNWRNIPGTTSVQDTIKLPEIGWGSYNNASDFVGGLTLDNWAITSMQYQRDGVTANKSYFLFPEFTVCLGSGINGETNQHLQTTIEQCFSSTPLYFNKCKNKMEELSNKNKTTPNDCFWHQGSGYIINEGKKVVVDIEKRTPNWSKVITWPQPTEQDKAIFQLVIDHGKKVQNDTYAYAVFPTITRKALTKINKKQPYQILSNTRDIQAVKYGLYTSIVFHQPGTVKINNKTELSSTTPAIILCKEEKKNRYSIAISDPTQRLESGQIRISGIAKSEKTSVVHDITFPDGIDKGRPVIFKDI